MSTNVVYSSYVYVKKRSKRSSIVKTFTKDYKRRLMELKTNGLLVLYEVHGTDFRLATVSRNDFFLASGRAKHTFFAITLTSFFTASNDLPPF